MSIRMHTPVTHGKPGAVVGGSVIICVPPSTTFHLAKVDVIIIGVINKRTTKMDGSNVQVYESREVFFEMKQDYDKGPKDLRSDYAYHFTLVLPPDPTSKLDYPNDPRPRPLPKLLPPSGELSPGLSIQYSLNVSVLEGTTGQEITSSTPMRFSKTRALDTPDPEVITLAEERTLPLPLTRSFQTTFALAMFCPQVIIQEQPLCLRVRLWRELDPDYDIPAPRIQLKHFAATLVTYTSVKGKNVCSAKHTAKHVLASFDSNAEGSNRDEVDITGKDLDLGALCAKDLRVSRDSIPTFRYAGIKRCYRLLISVRAECQDKLFDFDFEIDAVTILAEESAAARLERDGIEYEEWASTQSDPKFRVVGQYRAVLQQPPLH